MLLHEVLDGILAECTRQKQLWGSQRHHSLEKWYTILGEEIGELAKEILELPEKDDKMYEENLSKLKVEAIQCAAVICSMLEVIE